MTVNKDVNNSAKKFTMFFLLQFLHQFVYSRAFGPLLEHVVEGNGESERKETASESS